jgi:hypothetical protein
MKLQFSLADVFRWTTIIGLVIGLYTLEPWLLWAYWLTPILALIVAALVILKTDTDPPEISPPH